MRDLTPAPATRSITVAYELPEPPERVWMALTDPAILGAWLMPNDIRAEAGWCFTFRSKPIGGWDGVVHCKVIEVVPEQRLSYTWCNAATVRNGRNEPDLDTVVVWTLTATPQGGTTLHLEHSGFGGDSFAFQMMGQGWRGKAPHIVSAIRSLP